MLWLFYITIFCVLYYFYDHIGLALWAKELKGKIVLITGGAHGIGKGTAKELAKLGAKVVLWDINKNNLDLTVEEIKSGGGEAWGFVCDVSKPENVYAVAKDVKSTVGTVDILMNNAGIVMGKELLDTSDEETMRVINVNTMAQFWTVKAFMPDMIARNSGHIVNIASVMGHFATYKLVDYSVSKFAVVGFSDGLRTELRKKGVSGVKITYINPNAINTGMFSGISFLKPLQSLMLLEEPWVVEQIVKAIKLQKARVFLPWLSQFAVGLRYFLPIQAFDFITQDVMAAASGMDTFTGHKKTN
jgi:all-trans-retinol dehydrogenase (NAD+)